ncbi:MAG: hypothetical protein J6A51_02845, partial [Clostridia bacterium]|nr:hypothetical protein [Clostridia bacterium]
LLNTDKGICDLRVNENDELEFFKVVKNETIYIDEYAKDIYGHYFIKNNTLNVYDEETNTMFYTYNNVNGYQYIFSNEGTMISVKYGDFGFIEEVWKINQNFENEKIVNDEKYTFSNKQYLDDTFFMIENEALYYYDSFFIAAVSVLVELKFNESVELEDTRLVEVEGSIGSIIYTDENEIVMIKNDKLIVGTLAGENSLFNGVSIEFDISGRSPISTYEPIPGVIGIGWVYEFITPLETKYCTLIKNSDGEWEWINVKTYVAPTDSTVVKVQPLNKHR